MDDNNDLMRPKPQVDGYRMGDARGMGALAKREPFLRAPTRAILKEPDNDAGRQNSEKQAQQEIIGGELRFGRRPDLGVFAGSAIDQALADPSQWTEGLQATVRPQTSLDDIVSQLTRHPSFQAGLLGGAAARQAINQAQSGVTAESNRLVGERDTQRFYKAEVQPHPPHPASELDSALSAVSEANKALDDAVMRLEGRLGRIMRPEPTGKAPNSCPVMAPLPMEIMAGAACTLDAVDRLTSILDRLVL